MNIDDITMGEMKDMVDLITTLAEATMTHSLAMVTDDDHDCGDLEDDPFTNMPEMSDMDIKVFLAFEESALATCRMVRRGLQSQGWEEVITTEVGT